MTVSRYVDERYALIDRQSKRLVNTRWQAAGYSALAATMFLVAGGILLLGGLSAMSAVMAVGAIAGGIRARYLAESTRVEADIIAEDILDQREYANLSREIFRQQQLMQSQAPQYPAYGGQESYYAPPPQPYRAEYPEQSQPPSEETFVYRYGGPSFNIVKNIAPVKGSAAWTSSTQKADSQTQNQDFHSR